MMTAFDALAAEAWAFHFELWGRTVTYTPAGGEAVELTGMVGPVRSQPDEGYELGRRLIELVEITITTDPDSEFGGVADPAENATVTIGSTVWPVESIDEHCGLTVLHCRRELAVERSRPSYRL